MTENISDKPVTERFMGCLSELVEKGLILPSFSLRNDGEALPLTDNLDNTQKAQQQDPFDLAVNKKFTEFDGHERTTSLKPVLKSTPKTYDFDLAVEECFQKGFNAYVKAQKPEPAPKDPFDAAVARKLESL